MKLNQIQELRRTRCHGPRSATAVFNWIHAAVVNRHLIRESLWSTKNEEMKKKKRNERGARYQFDE